MGMRTSSYERTSLQVTTGGLQCHFTVCSIPMMFRSPTLMIRYVVTLFSLVPVSAEKPANWLPFPAVSRRPVAVFPTSYLLPHG